MKTVELGYDGKFTLRTPHLIFTTTLSLTWMKRSQLGEDESLMFDDEEGGITIEEYGTRNYVTLTNKETKVISNLKREVRGH